MTEMKDYKMISKISIALCLCLIVLAVINGFTGFINQSITIGGTAICIAGLCAAMAAITILEHERAKKKNS